MPSAIALGVLAVLLCDLLGARDAAGNHPLLVSVVAVLAAVVLAIAGGMRWLVGLDIVLIAATVIAASPLTTAAADRWVRNDSLGALAGRPADAIVVLSGGMKSDSAINLPSLDRLLTGLELFRAGDGRRLVTTRELVRIRGGVATPDSDQARLVRLAGAESAWTVVGPVASTRTEALRTARLLAPAAGRTIVVVTSPLHTRRACATFERLGFVVICRAAREHEYVTWHAASPGDRLAAFRAYLYERAGMIKYEYEGWVARSR